MLLAMLTAVSSQAQDRESTIDELDIDRPPETPNRLGEHWSFGGLLELDVLADRDLDLDSGFEDDLVTIEPRLSLALAYESSANVSAFTEIEIAQGIYVHNEADLSNPDASITLEQAYLTFSDIYPGFSLQLGRQLFKDERNWWYKEEMDAIRLLFQTERFGLELSASRNELIAEDLLNRDSTTEESDNYFLVSRYAYGDELEFNAYVFKQEGRSEEHEDPLFFGIRSIGEIGSNFEHWVDAAIVRGTDDGRDIRAYGIDVGLTYETELPLYPLFTLGIAFGSGDSNPEDDVDGNFRQTGLQENFYYGELLAPELSNLWIFTVGASVYPTDNISVDFLYHYYRQHHAADELRNAFIDQDPDGRHRDLGRALSFVMSYSGIEDLNVGIILGTFFPEDAFAEDAPTAYFGEFLISYQF